jgi:hypothetical protein
MTVVDEYDYLSVYIILDYPGLGIIGYEVGHMCCAQKVYDPKRGPSVPRCRGTCPSARKPGLM